jgi:hypothetical protein
MLGMSLTGMMGLGLAQQLLKLGHTVAITDLIQFDATKPP